MGAVEVTPWPAKNKDNSYQYGNDWEPWVSLGVIAAFVLAMVGLLVWAIVTPPTKDPHAGQVCVRTTDEYVPVTLTDMWGHTTTTWQYQTQCLEWVQVQHTNHVTPGPALPGETQQTITRTQPQDRTRIQDTAHTASPGTTARQPTLPTLHERGSQRRT